MTSPEAPRGEEPPPLTRILDDLWAIMDEERRAIARLDLTAVEALTARKQALCVDLAAHHPAGLDLADRDLARRVVQVRVALGANSALIAAASEAIAATLGIQRDDRYDRAARRHGGSRPMRTITL